MRMKVTVFQIFMHCIILPICLGLFSVIALSFFLSYEKAIIFAFLLPVLAIFFQIPSFIFSVSFEGEILFLQKWGKVYQFYLQEISIETEIRVKNLIFKDQIMRIKTLEEEREFDLSLMSLQKFRELESILKNKGGNTMSSKMYIILLLVACGIYYAIMIPSYRKKKKQQKEYIQTHPDVVKVYIKPALDQNIEVKSVDGEKPDSFNEGLRWGFLVKAGERELEMQSRITEKTSMIMMKEITEIIYGPDKISYHFEAGHKYQLTFDSEIKAYKIDLIE